MREKQDLRHCTMSENILFALDVFGYVKSHIKRYAARDISIDVWRQGKSFNRVDIDFQVENGRA